MEIIYQNSTKRFNNAELTKECFLGLPKSNLRLDYHGIVDTLPKDFDISDCAVISYVGTRTLEKTRKILEGLASSNKIKFGVLVFKRGLGPGENEFVEVGSKAWVCSCLEFDGYAIFLDDSHDHVNSVNFIGIPNHEAIQTGGSATKKKIIDSRIKIKKMQAKNTLIA